MKTSTVLGSALTADMILCILDRHYYVVSTVPTEESPIGTALLKPSTSKAIQKSIDLQLGTQYQVVDPTDAVAIRAIRPSITRGQTNTSNSVDMSATIEDRQKAAENRKLAEQLGQDIPSVAVDSTVGAEGQVVDTVTSSETMEITPDDEAAIGKGLGLDSAAKDPQALLASLIDKQSK